MIAWTVGLGAVLALVGAVAVLAQGGDRGAIFRARGQSLFQTRCASCHDPASGRAPARADLGQRDPDDIVAALKTGAMAPMVKGLGDLDLAAVAYYLTGRPPGLPVAQVADPPPCPAPDAFATTGPAWNGWSNDRRNWRLQPDPGLAAADVPRLKVKWSMTYVGGRYGQPTLVGGRVFLTSAGGRIYSLDAATGCLRWRFDVPGGARSTVVVGALPGVAPSGYAAFFGDLKRNVWALDAATGALIWKTNIDPHPLGVITGSPTLYQGRLYVPMSSIEETVAGAADYGCCTARGSLTALDAATGKPIWKTYAIAETPAPTRRNAAGTQMYGPAGAAVWSTPTIDARRGAVLFATGDSYTDTPEEGSDAVIALDLATGAVRWKRQVTEGDNFLAGCAPARRLVNCPTTVGPDADFGGSPILLTLANGKDIVLAGQKSGLVFGIDPDGGRILWSVRVGAGGALGGIEWGMASDGTRLYVANADPFSPSGGARPGLYALDPATGTLVWATPAPKPVCSWPAGLRCFNAQSAAPSVIPGLVLATTTDGHLRAYRTGDGKIVWDFDTAARTYDTINGVAGQRGGSLDVAGPTLAGGMLFLMSGYQGPMGGVADNVLLAMSVDGK